MGSIDKFCERMRYWCEEVSVGYDQSNRWDIRPGGECDCSSLVYWCLWEAGFLAKPAGNLYQHLLYTGTIRKHLTDAGWEVVTPDGNPKRGDVLLSDANHVAVWLGDSLAQASIDENGNISGGASGDQTGLETNIRSYYSYPWDCYLRYAGEESEETETDTDSEEEDMAAAIYWFPGGAALRTDNDFKTIPDENALNVIRADYYDRHGKEIPEMKKDSNWLAVFKKMYA